MEIAIFEDVTTESVLSEIEAEAKTYTGLYVEMDNAPERKYVKDHAAKITGIIKKLNRARIDKKKEHAATIEREYESIVARLELANEPFTLLLDEYKAKRAKELAAEKAIAEAKALEAQIESDHEIGLLINKTFEADKVEAERIAKEEAERIQAEADARAEQRQKEINEAIERDKINAENARLANVEHVRAVNNDILGSMLSCGLDKEQSIKFIKLIANKRVASLTINY